MHVGRLTYGADPDYTSFRCILRPAYGRNHCAQRNSRANTGRISVRAVPSVESRRPNRLVSHLVFRLGFIPQFNCAPQELAILCRPVFLEKTLDVRQLVRSGVGTTEVADWHEPIVRAKRVLICPVLHFLMPGRIARPMNRLREGCGMPRSRANFFMNKLPRPVSSEV
jgi:hypothetical protein